MVLLKCFCLYFSIVFWLIFEVDFVGNIVVIEWIDFLKGNIYLSWRISVIMLVLILILILFFFLIWVLFIYDRMDVVWIRKLV